MEHCRVEGEAALRIFDAGFVVPQRLVVISAEAPEGLQIATRAERHVDRVVDAAQAEALGRLNVDAEVVRRLPRGDHARRESVRLRLVAKADDVVGELAARDEVAFLVEAVITPAAGHLELAEVVARFAEEGPLLDVVGQIGVVGIVRNDE